MVGEGEQDEDGAAGAPFRNETPAERLDRNWSELLQELRVTQTGIQILSGFVLGVVAAVVAGVLALLVFAALWLLVPARLARANDGSYT